MDIEKEIQARVAFKMNELLTALENTAKKQWMRAIGHNSARNAHYWEAFSQMSNMLKTEMEMAVPLDEMAEASRREKRDKAVKNIMNALHKEGDRGYEQKLQVVVREIEAAQRW